MEDRYLWGQHKSLPVGQCQIRHFGWQQTEVKELDGESLIRDFVWQ
jgi:hypothetical protein